MPRFRTWAEYQRWRRKRIRSFSGPGAGRLGGFSGAIAGTPTVEDSGNFWMEITDNDAGTFGVELKTGCIAVVITPEDPGGLANWTIVDNQTSTRQIQIKITGDGSGLGWDGRTFLGNQFATGNVASALTFGVPNLVVFTWSDNTGADAWDVSVNGVSIGSGTYGFNAGVAPFEWWFQTDDGSTYNGGGIIPQIAKYGYYYLSDDYVTDVAGTFMSNDGGADGSGFTGTVPFIYTTGNAAVWNAGINLGSGLNWTGVNGTMNDA